MASFWQKTLFYLGLVDEEPADDVPAVAGGDDQVQTVAPQPTVAPSGSSVRRVRPPGTVSGRRVEPPAMNRRRFSTEPEHAEAGLILHPQDAAHHEPEADIIVARTFADAQTLADAIRRHRAVVLDLRSTEPEMVRRLVDFSSGLTYALDGRMSKIAKGVILVTPPGVVLSVAEQERLGALGLYAPRR